MHFTTIAQILGIMGLTPVRAFLPAFLSAVILRIGGIPYLGPVVEGETALAPTWFTHDITILVLGILALAELFATKSPELRSLLETLDQYDKPVLAVITVLGILSYTDAAAVQVIHGSAAGHASLPLGVMPLGRHGVGTVLVVLVFAGTFFLCTLRQRMFDFVRDIDPDDSTGVQGLLAWAEEAWVLGTVLLLFIVPVVVLVGVGVTTGGLWVLERMLARRMEGGKEPCASCGCDMLPLATGCARCGAARGVVPAVGCFGRRTNRLTSDLAAHRLRLLRLRRCPVCATRLPRRSPDQTCGACGHILLDGEELPAAYIEFLDRRLPKVLGGCALMGMVPILGVIAAMVYYRIVLIAPLRMYIGLRRGLFSKWAGRLAGFVLLAMFAWVPVLSMGVAPILAWVNYRIYRRAFLAQVSTSSTVQGSIDT